MLFIEWKSEPTTAHEMQEPVFNTDDDDASDDTSDSCGVMKGGYEGSESGNDTSDNDSINTTGDSNSTSSNDSNSTDDSEYDDGNDDNNSSEDSDNDDADQQPDIGRASRNRSYCLPWCAVPRKLKDELRKFSAYLTTPDHPGRPGQILSKATLDKHVEHILGLAGQANCGTENLTLENLLKTKLILAYIFKFLRDRRGLSVGTQVQHMNSFIVALKYLRWAAGPHTANFDSTLATISNRRNELVRAYSRQRLDRRNTGIALIFPHFPAFSHIKHAFTT